MKKMYICMLVLSFVLLVGCGKKPEKGLEVVTEEKSIPVKTQEVVAGEIANEFKYSSTFLAEEKVAVIPKVQGEVEEVYFEIGNKVKKDDVLFKIDKESVEKQIEDLEKQLKNVNLTIDLQKISLDSSKGSQYEQQLNQVEQQVKMSEISYNDAKENLEDMTKLFEKGAITKQQFDQVESGLDQAEIGYDAAKKSYDLFINQLSKESINVSENQYNQAVVRKEQLLLTYNNAKDTLEDTEVKAPISGIISQRGVDPHDMISGQSIPFTIVKMDNLLVEVGVSEKMVNKIKVADKVKVKVKVSGETVDGEITAISPAADERSMTYLTKIEVKNNDYKIKPGMFLDVLFQTDKIKYAIIIPIDAVINYEEENFVYIMRDNKAKKVAVELGINNGKNIQIISGLTKGDQVIIEGQNYVEEGSKVKIVG